MQHEAEFTFSLPDGREEPMICTFNHRAMRTIKQISGLEPFPYLMDTQPGIERIQDLSFAMTESFRRANKIVLSHDDWIDQDYPGGRYLSPSYVKLADFIERMITETFPEVVSMRAAIAATKTKPRKSKRNLESQSTIG